MRPTPIPDAEIWEGAQRVVVGPPGNDLDSVVAPVEAIADTSEGAIRLSVRCIVEDDDLEQLNAGGTVWLTFLGHMVPFSITVQPPAVPVPHVRIEVQPHDDKGPDFRATLGGVPYGLDAADFAEGCAEALLAMADEWRAAATPS